MSEIRTLLIRFKTPFCVRKVNKLKFGFHVQVWSFLMRLIFCNMPNNSIRSNLWLIPALGQSSRQNSPSISWSREKIEIYLTFMSEFMSEFVWNMLEGFVTVTASKLFLRTVDTLMCFLYFNSLDFYKCNFSIKTTVN